MRSILENDCLAAASYYAPRGAERLLALGNLLANRYLKPDDRLIGVIGEPGMGKSSLIRGMFPGLELTSDDDGIKIRPLPLQHVNDLTYFSPHTYHLDIRLEAAFEQIGRLSELIRSALVKKRRVIVEHFEMVYPVLKVNADFLIGIGEEIIIARPNIFGPYPKNIHDSVEGTGIYRKMAHTAEHLILYVLIEFYGYELPKIYSDFPRGFVIEFDTCPSFDIQELEDKVTELIKQDIEVKKGTDGTVSVAGKCIQCTEPRIHVNNTAEISNFRLLKKTFYDPISGTYKLVGLVGESLPKSYSYQLYMDGKDFEG